MSKSGKDGKGGKSGKTMMEMLKFVKTNITPGTKFENSCQFWNEVESLLNHTDVKIGEFKRFVQSQRMYPLGPCPNIQGGRIVNDCWHRNACGLKSTPHAAIEGSTGVHTSV